jgi:hypothetical protein
MQKTIPVHLASTYDLVKCAFPQGIDESSYWPLLSVLAQNMSDRSLAQIVADFTAKDYHQVLNDIYRVSSEPCSLAILEPLLKRLEHCGYEQWLAEEA